MPNTSTTADGWTGLTQDHYLTVILQYVRQGRIIGKVLKTKAVYDVQTGAAVAEEITASSMTSVLERRLWQ